MEITQILEKGIKLIQSHFIGLSNILQIIKLKKVKKFVQIGSPAEYGNIKPPFDERKACLPNTPYSIAKFFARIFA